MYLRSASNCINRVHFGPCSGRNFSITFQSISKMFRPTVLARVIQLCHFPLCKASDILCYLTPTMELKWTTHYIIGSFRIMVAFKSHIRVEARASKHAFGTSDGRRYVRQSLWDESRRVSHCPTNWCAFLFRILSHSVII